MPVRYTSDPFPKFGGSWEIGYLLPSDEFYYDPPYLWTSTFYCTEQQAIDDGLELDAMSDSRWKQ